MGFLSWIAIGLVAGALGKFLLPGKDPGGWFITILIGIAGALLGGYISSYLGFGTVTGFFDLKSLAIATGGSIILLLAYRLVKSK
ncbi:MAG: GlsB/YeaQ/YmgE family stress response membrane protein [Spirochaetales bacterium]|nr:GlsB/YeaQ/YmgE family stress response membrane protein [Spirochaetales bacterium]